MDLALGILCAALAAIVLLLSFKLLLIRRSAEQICSGFAQRLRQDTNTLIDISGGDRTMRELAARINEELRLLRQERRRYLQGDGELKEAVTNISHDLRTPLTAILGYLELLRREEQSEQAARYVDMIADRTQVMKQLTEELFRYSVAASIPSLTGEKLCLNDILASSLAAYYGAMTERGIQPEISMPEEPVERFLDRGALNRILANVLGNAVKYSAGDLTVTLSGDGEIVFANTAEDLDYCMAGKLFDRYFTVETGKDSTGLGLSIARLLTEQMGGNITADYRKGMLFVRIGFPE